MNKGPFFLRRIARTFLWGSPRLYRCFGLLRARGDCCQEDFDFWIAGFPRSANTFAVEAFGLANPTVRLASHRHVPAFIIHWLSVGKPGLFLVRRPTDAAASWAVYWNSHLKDSLDYYIDFHQILLPYTSQLTVATFEDVTRDFGQVIEQVNRCFGARYVPFRHDPEAVSKCFSRIEEACPFKTEGVVNEMMICRPSAHRDAAKEEVLAALKRSRTLARKLEKANALFDAFCRAPGRVQILQPGSPAQSLPQSAPPAARANGDTALAAAIDRARRPILTPPPRAGRSSG